jgi:hypothetical protein
MRPLLEVIKEQARDRSETEGYGMIHASCVRSHELMTVTAISETDSYDMLVTLYTYRLDGQLVGADDIERRMGGYLPALVAGEL